MSQEALLLDEYAERIAQLEAALKPFAEAYREQVAAGRWPKRSDGDDYLYVDVTVMSANLKRAAELV